MGQYLKKCQYLGHPVLGSTLEHMQWEESKAGLKRNLRASPNEYGNSEERVNETQVKKALFCRDLAFYKGDSRWPSSQERCGSIGFLARMSRKPGQEGGGLREADWVGGGACKLRKAAAWLHPSPAWSSKE